MEPSMSNTTEEPTAQELAQDHPPSWSEVFNDLGDQAAYTPQDQPAPPGPRSSARRHAGRVAQGQHEARHEQNMAQLQTAARRQQDAQASAEVLRRIAKGQDISPALAEQAMRHQREQGGLGLSTAERLSAATLARLRREAPPDDGRRRRRP
jgi:hypothetical protein